MHMPRAFRGRLPTIVFAILAYGAVYFLLHLLYHPIGQVLPRQWTDSADQKVELPFYRLVDQPSTIRIKQKVIVPRGSALVLPRVSGNRILIFLNNQQVAAIGAARGTGNIWTGFHWIDLPDVAGESVLELEITGAYDLGIREVPYLAPSGDIALFRWVTSVLFNELYWLVLGLILALGALQIYYAQIDPRLRKTYWLNTAGILLGGFYLFDFAIRSDSGTMTSYLWARKLMLSAGYAAPLLMLMAMEYYTRKKLYFSKFTLLTTAVAAGLAISAGSLSDLKKWSVLTAGLAQLNWLFLLIIAFRTRHNVIVFAVTFFYCTLVGSVFSMISPSSHIFMIQIGYVFAITSVVYNMIEEFGRVHEDYRTAYRKSRTDPLTGAYNRFILDEVTVEPGDAVVLIDMNNFKVINDAFGHHAGDRVLVEWVKSAQLHTDQSDMIIRTGGDEFIILVRGARETDMNRILEDFQQRVSDLPASFSYGIEKIQTTLHDAIQNADQRMYAHKKNSRSTWIRRLWQRRQKKTA